MDYRCGYCRRAAPDVESLVAGDGNIRFVLKEFPILGEQSMIASRFAIATKQVAGEDAYKAVHDALIAYKGEINETALTRMAGTLGLEAGPILDSMDSDAVSEVIAKNHRPRQDAGDFRHAVLRDGRPAPAGLCPARGDGGYGRRDPCRGMRRRRRLCGPILLAALAGPGAGVRRISPLSPPTERAIFHDEIRAVLLTVPELLPDTAPPPAPEAADSTSDEIARDLARMAAHARPSFPPICRASARPGAAQTIALFTTSGLSRLRPGRGGAARARAIARPARDAARHGHARRPLPARSASTWRRATCSRHDAARRAAAVVLKRYLAE